MASTSSNTTTTKPSLFTASEFRFTICGDGHQRVVSLNESQFMLGKTEGLAVLRECAESSESETLKSSDFLVRLFSMDRLFSLEQLNSVLSGEEDACQFVTLSQLGNVIGQMYRPWKSFKCPFARTNLFWARRKDWPSCGNVPVHTGGPLC